jgi:hypothetical protein
VTSTGNEGYLKKSFKMVFQMSLRGECYENHCKAVSETVCTAANASEFWDVLQACLALHICTTPILRNGESWENTGKQKNLLPGSVTEKH